MITEINMIIEAVEGEKTYIHSSYKVDGAGYVLTAITNSENNNNILTPETEIDIWIKALLVSGVKHILNIENECFTEPVQIKFCLFIKEKDTVTAITKGIGIGIAEINLVEDGSLCKISYDIPYNF